MSINIGNILLAHLQKSVTKFSANSDFIANEDLSKWVVRIRGLDGIDDCLKGSETLIEYDTTQKFGAEKLSYPFNPPRFKIWTPNGKYGHDGIVCVGVGEYHNQMYNQNLGIPGFNELIIQSFVSLNETGKGIRVNEEATPEGMKKLGLVSREYNIRNHEKDMVRLDIHFLSLIASKLWSIDPENPGRLIEVGSEADRKQFAKKIIGATTGMVIATKYYAELATKFIETNVGPIDETMAKLIAETMKDYKVDRD